jgi:hypothetical protein
MIGPPDLVCGWRQLLNGLAVEYVECSCRSVPDEGGRALFRLPQVDQWLLVTRNVTPAICAWCREVDEQSGNESRDVPHPAVVIGLPRGRFRVYVRGWATDGALVYCRCGGSYFVDRSLGWACPRCGRSHSDHHWICALDSPLREHSEEAA